MRRRLAALVARSPFGQGAWPIVETVQREGIASPFWRRHRNLSDASCRPAGVADRRGTRCGGTPSNSSETTDGALVVNELAMRPHNSGHWTMNGSVTSQFEQHLRAVLDYPLGDLQGDRSGGGDGQRARCRRRHRRWVWTSGCTTCSAGFRTRTCISTARASGPAARSAT